ncbi:MAG TPA: hypothetical protein VF713_11050 [Thermoanaerobaculia bacterium]
MIAAKAVDEDDVGLAIGVVTACDLVQSAQGSASFRKAIRISIVGERQFYTLRTAHPDNSCELDRDDAKIFSTTVALPEKRAWTPVARGAGLWSAPSRASSEDWGHVGLREHTLT